MNRRELETAIEREVEQWPDVSLTFADGGKHPKAKLRFADLLMAVTYSSTPSDVFAITNCLGDVRRTLRKLGATRTTPEPSKEEDEAPYRKPNPGREMRENPVVSEPVEQQPDMADQLAPIAQSPAAATESTSAATPAPRPKVVYVPDRDEADEEAEAAAANAVFDAKVAAIVDGIYFGLDEEVYHAVPRLSTSALQKIAISPGDWWKDSWLDPNPTILTPEQEAVRKVARTIGRAYHTAHLEPDLLPVRFVREIDKRDFPVKGFLSSDEKVKAALKGLGVQQAVSGESTVDRAERLIDAGYEGVIWPLEKAKWDADLARRSPRPIPISAKTWDEIIIDMARIHGNEEVGPLLTDGAAEVSIFYTDAHGIQMKQRVDYLTAKAWKDFKSFANPNGKELETAIADAIRYNRYHMQAVSYRDGIEAVRVGGLQIVGDATDEERALIAAIQIKPAELECWYIFQQKGGVPNLLAYEFDFYEVPLNTRVHNAITDDEAAIERAEAASRRKTLLHMRARQDLENAKRQFVLYSQVYKPGRPWAPINAKRSFSDLGFNQYWLEGKA